MTLIDKVADAIDGVAVFYEIRLVRLVDGVSTYALRYEDDSRELEFSSHNEASEHVRAKQRVLRAAAAIKAVQDA